MLININTCLQEPFMRNGYVVASLRTGTCAFCGEIFGGKKVDVHQKSGMLVHRRKCHDEYDLQVKGLERQERANKEAAKLQQTQAEHDANKKRRGTCLDTYCTDMRKAVFETDVPKETRDECHFFDRIYTELQRAQEYMDDFREKLKEDPAYTMSWSMNAFEKAATIRVNWRIDSFFEAGFSVKEIKDICEEEIFRAARSTSQSTSPASNIMDRELLAAWTKARASW